MQYGFIHRAVAGDFGELHRPLAGGEITELHIPNRAHSQPTGAVDGDEIAIGILAVARRDGGDTEGGPRGAGGGAGGAGSSTSCEQLAAKSSASVKPARRGLGSIVDLGMLVLRLAGG